MFEAEEDTLGSLSTEELRELVDQVLAERQKRSLEEALETCFRPSSRPPPPMRPYLTAPRKS
jgi:hypothetical protein